MLKLQLPARTDFTVGTISSHSEIPQKGTKYRLDFFSTLISLQLGKLISVIFIYRLTFLIINYIPLHHHLKHIEVIVVSN